MKHSMREIALFIVLPLGLLMSAGPTASAHGDHELSENDRCLIHLKAPALKNHCAVEKKKSKQVTGKILTGLTVGALILVMLEDLKDGEKDSLLLNGGQNSRAARFTPYFHVSEEGMVAHGIAYEIRF